MFRNLWTRKLTTLLTAGGMALVAFVFAAVLMLDAGLNRTMAGTGSVDNVIFIRKGAETEIQSGITRDQAALVESQPQVARGADGNAVASKESLVLISLTKTGQDKASNIVTRGVSPTGFQLRPQVRIVQGRMFQPGSSEIVVGKSIHDAFDGVAIGQKLRFAQREWLIVGNFDAGKSAFDSEVWGDVEQLMQAFRRTNFSSVIVKMSSVDNFDALVKAVADDIRIALEGKRERLFYEDQSRALSTFISFLGIFLSVIFSVGAMIGVDHHVFFGRDAHRRNWYLACARFQATIDSRGVPDRVAVARSGGRVCRSRVRSLPANNHDFDDEFPIVFATGVRLHSHDEGRAVNAVVLARDGLCRRISTGRKGVAHEDRGFLACRLNSHPGHCGPARAYSPR